MKRTRDILNLWYVPFYLDDPESSVSLPFIKNLDIPISFFIILEILFTSITTLIQASLQHVGGHSKLPNLLPQQSYTCFSLVWVAQVLLLIWTCREVMRKCQAQGSILMNKIYIRSPFVAGLYQNLELFTSGIYKVQHVINRLSIT